MTRSDPVLYDAAQSRETDARAIAGIPVPGFELMQRAADAAFAALLRHFPGVGSVSVLCGKGNNAGDAYLVAQRAHEYGLRVQLIALVAPEELTGDAARAFELARGVGLHPADAHTPLRGEVVVDGLLGTGISGAPREPFASAIGRINASGLPVLSIDVPSGVDVDTGAVHSAAVRAQVTVSFITRKLGLYTGDGLAHAGQREFVDLGVPHHLYSASAARCLTWASGLAPQLPLDTYKHRQGHVVVAGGDVNMPGAVAMAAEAALRVGAGMVTVLTHGSHNAIIVTRTPEVMVVDVASELVPALLQRADLLVLGPGLGREAWGEYLYLLVENCAKPVVLDADGLYWLARSGAWRGGPLVITPHTAEAARLLARDAASIQADRPGAARALAQRYGCQGVLKGPGSIVFGGAQLAVCMHGNPGMASAGMGDVLSGMVAGLLADVAGDNDQELRLRRLQAAVALHSAAADAAAARLGQRSLLATDVTAQLPELLRCHEAPGAVDD